MATRLFPSSAIPSRRDHLRASLQALLINDDIDLDLFKPGASWPPLSPPTPTPPPPVNPSSPNTEREPDTFLLGSAVGGGHMAIDPFLLAETSLAACNTDQFAPSFSLQPQSSTPASGSSTMMRDAPTVHPRHGRSVRAAIPRADSHAKRSRSHLYQDEYGRISTARTPDPRLRVDDLALDYRSRLSPREMDAENPVRGEDNPFSSPHAIDIAYPDNWNQSPVTSPEQAQSLSSLSADSGIWDMGQHPEKRQRQHYAVEKRYRAGLNERFNALRDCIESRRKIESERQPGRPGTGAADAGNNAESGGSGSLPSSTKMNKADVLHEAVVYIRDLEEENEVILEQLKLLVHRLRDAKAALGVTDPKQTIPNRKSGHGP
ncbi:hypothetical protein F5Y14DRAFT_405115 [Nemania sp. NC0429]|nr:hypothetical protein F5Y14DRAFT_405115 [Nemania sp. NC0429]